MNNGKSLAHSLHCPDTDALSRIFTKRGIVLTNPDIPQKSSEILRNQLLPLTADYSNKHCKRMSMAETENYDMMMGRTSSKGADYADY
jgi:hypothetical protein